MPKKIDKQHLLESVKELYVEQQMKLSDICKSLNISEPTLRKMIKDNNLNNPNLFITDNQKELIEEMYCKEGKVISTISDKLNISEKLVKDYIKQQGLIRNSHSRFSSHELDIDMLNGLEHLKRELMIKHNDNPYILTILSKCEMNVLLSHAREYCNNMSLSIEGEDGVFTCKTKDNKKLKDINKLSKYLEHMYRALYDILWYKVWNTVKPVLDAHDCKDLNIPYPIFNGAVYNEYNTADGTIKKEWRKKFGVDMLSDEFSRVIKSLNESIMNNDEWDYDLYLQINHPELFSNDLYSIEYEHINTTFLEFDMDLGEICIIYDFLKDQGYIKESLDLTKEEQELFDSYSSFDSVCVVIDNSTKMYKNYKRLSICKTISEYLNEEATRETRLLSKYLNEVSLK